MADLREEHRAVLGHSSPTPRDCCTSLSGSGSSSGPPAGSRCARAACTESSNQWHAYASSVTWNPSPSPLRDRMALVDERDELRRHAEVAVIRMVDAAHAVRGVPVARAADDFRVLGPGVRPRRRRVVQEDEPFALAQQLRELGLELFRRRRIEPVVRGLERSGQERRRRRLSAHGCRLRARRGRRTRRRRRACCTSATASRRPPDARRATR